MKIKTVNIVLEEDLIRELGRKNQFTMINFELTRRCTNDCRHCYVNLPPDDLVARNKELSCNRIKEIIDEAAGLGALFSCFTGGDPLLREDFSELYIHLKEKGLLPSVMTNATLIDEKIIKLFKKYPPRNVEVTVYGVREETYEKVTRVPGSFGRFWRGLNLLLENKIRVELKAMVLASNFREHAEIRKFCKERNSRSIAFRADPFVFLRQDGNQARNKEIKEERLKINELLEWEKSFAPGCMEWVKQNCRIGGSGNTDLNKPFFPCSPDNFDCTITNDGFFLICPFLRHKDYSLELKKPVTLREAFETLSPKISGVAVSEIDSLKECRDCKVQDYCIKCPGRCYLETGKLESPPPYLCKIAHARAEEYSKILSV